MPRVGFDPTTAEFERAKTVHASDRAVTVTGTIGRSVTKFSSFVKLHI
jgi:hypothetical protein